MDYPKSERLVFQAWTTEDLPQLHTLNSNEQTMAFFPGVLDLPGSEKLLARFINHFDEYGFTYDPVRDKSNGLFIGFIGCKWQEYKNPAGRHVDIGWRLLPAYWGKGFATEGARACLNFVFSSFDHPRIYSTAPAINKASISVMKKIGMSKFDEFKHPLLSDFPKIEECQMYVINRPPA